MNFWKRLVLGLKVIFGRYRVDYIYRNPRVGISQATLRHKYYNWDEFDTEQKDWVKK